MEPILTAQNLHKSFGAVHAVRGVSFAIAPGEILGLLGPNGAGKTTLIQMLLGVITPDAGSIEIFGKSLAGHREDILRETNFSSSYISLPGNLTAGENLSIFARLYGVKDAKARIDELLSLFDLEGKRNTLTGKLSSGQLTRLYLAKAFINRPRLLLLDEPTASLDPEIADRTRRTLLDFSVRDGVTMLYTSHNMPEVEAMCKRVIFLHHGRVLAEGSPAKLMQRFGKANLEELFIHIAREVPEGFGV